MVEWRRALVVLSGAMDAMLDEDVNWSFEGVETALKETDILIWLRPLVC